MIDKKYKLIFILVISIAIVFLKSIPAQAETEQVTLTTYYPSPSGVYDEIEVTNKLTISNSLILLEDAILTMEGITDPLIDTSGNIKVDGVDFNGGRFYTPMLTARKLQVRDLSDMEKWKVGPIEAYDAGPWPSYPNPDPIDCGDGMVNRILNSSFASGIPVPWASVWSPFGCITIPTGQGWHIVLCAGWESFRMDYFCIEPE